jgi:hypothetical protein
MSFRLFSSLLALCVPALALAQPVITITPKVGANIQTTLGLKKCVDEPNTDISLYTVSVTTPPIGGTITVKLGDKCTDDTDCLTIVNAQPIAASIDVSLTPAELIDIIGETDCLSDGNGIGRQLTVFVEVIDPSGVTQPTKKDTGDNEDLFIDTIKPFEALTPAAEGGEGNLKISWVTNPENDEPTFPVEQENSFRIECRLTGSGDNFVTCGGSAAGIFTDTINKLNNNTLKNDISVDAQIITLDLAGNESVPTATFTGTPQDILDFGENFNGAEQGGCAVGHGEGQLFWVGFLIVVISLLRRNKNEAQL